jgi:hypothetical protein
MKKGIVKCLRVQGAGKRTYAANEVVSDDCFPTGVFDKLVSEGKVVETKSEPKAAKQAKSKSTDEEVK